MPGMRAGKGWCIGAGLRNEGPAPPPLVPRRAAGTGHPVVEFRANLKSISHKC